MFEKSFKKVSNEYHDFYIQCDALLPENVFENFRNKRIETYWLARKVTSKIKKLSWAY